MIIVTFLEFLRLEGKVKFGFESEMEKEIKREGRGRLMDRRREIRGERVEIGMCMWMSRL